MAREPMTNRTIWISVAVGAVIALVVVIVAQQSKPSSGPGTAYVMCTNMAEQKLRNPDSTEWPSSPDSIAGPAADGVYKIKVSGSSENGFGGTNRILVTCRIANTTGTDRWSGTVDVAE